MRWRSDVDTRDVSGMNPDREWAQTDWTCRDDSAAGSAALREILLLCLLLTIAADLLFYRQPVGWTAGLYCLALLLAVVCIDRATFLRTKPGVILAAIAGLLCLSLALQVGTLNMLLAGLTVATFSLASRCGWTSDAQKWLYRWWSFCSCGWAKIVQDAIQKQQAACGRRGRMAAAGLVLLKWSPVLALALLFTTLFAIANPLIAHWINAAWTALWRAIQDLRLPHPPRILLWLAVLIVSWALMRFRPAARGEKTLQRHAAPSTMEDFFLSPRILLGALAVFNLLFAVQNLLDLGYLWGAAELPNGMTYAEYAQRGAYPLVVTALLAAGFILIAFRPTSDSQRGKLARGLVFVWVAQNVLLTASAGWRLNLYVEIYSLTRLRVAAALWMTLVAAGLVLIFVRILRHRSNAWLINANILALLGLLLLCCFVNFDGFIARYNCRHSEERSGRGASLDLSYIRVLGPEALPAIAELRQELGDGKFADKLAKTEAHLKNELDAELRNWRGWTWRRQKLVSGASN